MAQIRQDFSFKADPNEVFKALSDDSHIRNWWTAVANVTPQKGSKGRLEFRPFGDFVDFTVTDLIPAGVVEWHVDRSRMLGTEEWDGTVIRFELETNPEGGTHLHLEHRGWPRETECLLRCIDGWGHYVGRSLRDYLERGHGEPVPEKVP